MNEIKEALPMATASIRIGEYTLSRFDDNHILIECDGGEGGSFSEIDLEEAIAKFYGENL